MLRWIPSYISNESHVVVTSCAWGKNVKIVKLLLLQSSIYVSKHNDGHSQEKMYKMFWPQLHCSNKNQIVWGMLYL